MPGDTMNGSVGAARTANTAKVESSSVPSSQGDRVKGIEPKANTANDKENDIRAYLQIMRQSAVNAEEAGVQVRVWESVDGQIPVVIFAVYRSRLCGICGNVYPMGENCGICAEAKKTIDTKQNQ